MSIDTLSRTQWFAHAAEEKVLHKLNVRWGVCGLNESPPSGLVFPKQVHGTKVATINKPQDLSHYPSDAIMAVAPLIHIAVRTADCLPILIASKDSCIVMAVHAGWKGLQAGIISNAINSICQYQVNKKSLRVLLGPCIRGNCYEVGPELVTAFSKQANPRHLELCLIKGVHDRWYFDQTTYAILELVGCGVIAEHISVWKSCTKHQQWYSYRRSGSKNCGSNWSWITHL